MKLGTMTVLLACATMFCLVWVGSAQADPPYWHRVLVDADGEDCGHWCSLAFDPNGNPAIAYFDGYGDLVVARLDPDGPGSPNGVWNKTVIASAAQWADDMGGMTLAFQPNGYPAVAYAYGEYVLGGAAWAYAWEDAGGWHSEDIPVGDVAPDFLPDVYKRVRLSFDFSGNPWVVLDVALVPCVLALAATPAEGPSGGWQVGTIIAHCSLSSPATRSDLAIDPNDGWPHVSFQNPEPGGTPPDEWVGLGSHDPGQPLEPYGEWSWGAVCSPDSIGGPQYGPLPTSLAFDSLGRAGIATFLAHGGTHIYYLSRATGPWTIRQVVEVPGLADDFSREAILAYRSDGNPGISYRGKLDSAPIWPMMYTWLDPTDPNEVGGVWQFREVDGRPVRGQANKGLYHSQAIDPNGLPAVAYYDSTFECLRYAVTADEPDTYQLDIEIEGGTGSWGTVEKDPDLERYPEGTIVTLTAVPNPDRSFVEWKILDPRYPGDSSHEIKDANNPIQLVMLYDMEVKAVFGCSGSDALFLAMVGAAVLTLGVVKLRRRWMA